MDNNSTVALLELSSSTTTTSTSAPLSNNDTIFNIISTLLNQTLYEHQEGDLIEPEKFSAHDVHIIIWVFTVVTYLFAIPIAARIVRTRAYLNIIDYFSFHIIICVFIAWIPALILLLYRWFPSFTLRLCRLHYVILTTNETVPLFFILYMIIERFLYAYPSIKQQCSRFSKMRFIHLYAIFTWFLTMFTYALVLPFTPRDTNSTLALYTSKYCSYDYSKLYRIATARSIIYFCLFVPSLILIGFVLRYFYIMRRTNQVPPIEKLWTIRVTSLICAIVFYDVYLYYLEHISETYQSFVLASILRSTFYLTQLIIISSTEPYWLEIVFERCACFCCTLIGQRRRRATPVAIPAETEINMLPGSSSAGHYSLVDSTINDEFEQVTNEPEPTLRIMA